MVRYLQIKKDTSTTILFSSLSVLILPPCLPHQITRVVVCLWLANTFINLNRIFYDDSDNAEEGKFIESKLSLYLLRNWLR